MGEKLIASIESGYCGASVAAAIDINLPTGNYPCHTDIFDVAVDADVIIDFSHHTAIGRLTEYAVEKKIPLVIATTGHTEEEKALAVAASEKIPVFMSGNMSIGIALLMELVRRTVEVFPDANVEIVEVHHNQKIDVPSGTALMLANAVKEVRGGEFNIGRHENGKRTRSEIGIHSLRTGRIIGEHEVRIDTGSQTITLKHESHGRELFAEGALCAAAYISVLEKGLYSVSDMIGRDCK